MASQVDICKLALGHIADAARVNSIDPPDNTLQAQHAATFFPIARDQCLEDFAWPFASKVTSLTESLVTLPDGEWTYVYNLPSDYIRALRVVPPGAQKDHPGQDYVIRSDEEELDTLLFTNVAEAKLHYIYREEETGRYSPAFITALSYLLGSFLAGPIVKGRVGIQLKQALEDAYRAQIDKAAVRAVGSGSQLNDQYGNHKPVWVSDR
jgi:hypothetical protein